MKDTQGDPQDFLKKFQKPAIPTTTSTITRLIYKVGTGDTLVPPIDRTVSRVNVVQGRTRIPGGPLLIVVSRHELQISFNGFIF